MDNMDDSENNAKISDSAYSNSCSNSQSRRSSKSTHSGSNSSGSSGYGGKPSTSGYSSTIQPTEKRLKEKDSKKKKQVPSEKLTTETQNEVENLPESAPISESPKEDTSDAAVLPTPLFATPEKGPERMDVVTIENTSVKEDVALLGSVDASTANASLNYVTSRPPPTTDDGFSCVISMHDGVVMYTTASLTTTLGFPKDMWVGRSFIDFVHPRDRNAFASQITIGLIIPKNTNGTQEKVQPQEDSSMVCRIRRYRGLTVGFGVKSSVVTFMPFLLKLSFKSVNNDDGDATYLVIQATPFYSAFKTPNEPVTKPLPFVIRHAANGNLEYLDPESVSYLGYLPQDVVNKDALHLYHPSDLVYLRQVYETIVREGAAPRCKPYRILAQNGDYIKLETEWSSFTNPWSKKLEFVIGKHYIVEGPSNPDVFQSPELNKSPKFSEEEKLKAQSLRESIVKILNEVLTKPAEAAKQQMSKRCQDLASFMETLLEEQPKTDDGSRLDIQDPDHSYYERDSVMLGGISPHHEYNDGKSSTETPVSYNQLNYNETLQRYFENHSSYSYEDYNTATGENIFGMGDPTSNPRDRMSPIAGGSDYEPVALASVGDYQHVRLTEAVMSKHNADMEKELVKMHRVSRSSSKGERETSTEKRQKKKEHLARCNASFQPTSAGMNMSDSQGSSKKPHGLKRVSSKPIEPESGSHKHHCPSTRLSRRRQPTTPKTTQVTPAVTTTVASSPWQMNPMNNMNTFYLGVGLPQQMSIVGPAHTMPGMFPMHYVSAHEQQLSTNTMANAMAAHTMSGHVMPVHTMPSHGMPTHTIAGNGMHGHAMVGNPIPSHPMGNQISGYVIPGHPLAGYPMPEHSMTGHPMPSGSGTTGNPMASSSMAANAVPGTSTSNPMAPNAMNTNAVHGHQMPSNPLSGNHMSAVPMSGSVMPANAMPGNAYGQFQAPAMQCLMYGQAVYGAPFMYSTVSPQVGYPMQQPCATQGVQYMNKLNSLGLASNNYVEACKPREHQKSEKPHAGNSWRERKRPGYPVVATNVDQGSLTSNSSLNRSTEAVRVIPQNNAAKAMRLGNSEDNMDKTDGESSYSSFYSSFFRTESGSAEESSDPKKANTKGDRGHIDGRRRMYSPAFDPTHIKKVARRKMEPPWMEQVCVSSELVYKYQVRTKNMDEVLSSDKQKMKTLEQPALVNEQLGQLYLDLQLEGVAARLTLEEGITSSSSSGEETNVRVAKSRRKKREYSKLVMIYEENASLPPPDSPPKASPS